MIEINLLPAEYKKEIKSLEEKLPINLILLSLNGLLFVILLVVSAFTFGRSITLHALNTRLKNLAPDQQKIIAIQQKIENFKKENELFISLFTPQVVWSKILNKLSDLSVNGIWLSRLSLEDEAQALARDRNLPTTVVSKYILISGTAVSRYRDEMVVIGDFIGRLKSDASFAGDFKNIEIESVVRRRIVDTEVMDFTLNCKFNQL